VWPEAHNKIWLYIPQQTSERIHKIQGHKFWFSCAFL